MINNRHFHLSPPTRTTSIYLFLQVASIFLASLTSINYFIKLFEVTVSMIKIIFWSYLYIHYITIKTKYTVIQFCSILMLIFHSKKSVRTQTSNYVKFKLLISENSIAILQWCQGFSIHIILFIFILLFIPQL